MTNSQYKMGKIDCTFLSQNHRHVFNPDLYQLYGKLKMISNASGTKID